MDRWFLANADARFIHLPTRGGLLRMRVERVATMAAASSPPSARRHLDCRLSLIAAARPRRTVGPQREGFWMRVSGMMLFVGLVACSAPGIGHQALDAASVPASPAAFTGPGRHARAPLPLECSRYVLYSAASASVALVLCRIREVVRGQGGRAHQLGVAGTGTHVCGRPGSETRTECRDGWDIVDRPLLLCDGKLGDLVGSEGRCLADYQAAPASRSGHAALSEQAWVRDCLSGSP